MDKAINIAVMALVIAIIVGFCFEPDLPKWIGPYVQDAIKAAFFVAAFLMDPKAVLSRLRGVTVPLPGTAAVIVASSPEPSEPTKPSS